MNDPAQAEDAMETEDTRHAPWTVTEFFLDPRRYNPSAEILHKAANVSSVRKALIQGNVSWALPSTRLNRRSRNTNAGQWGPYALCP